MNTKISIAIIYAASVVLASIANKLLPKESSVREALLKRIDGNVTTSLILNRSMRRDIPGVITLLLGVGMGFVVITLTPQFNWDWLDSMPPIIYTLLAVVPTLYLVGAIASKLEVRLRDEKGNPIREPYKHARTTIQHKVSLWGRSLLQPAKKRSS